MQKGEWFTVYLKLNQVVEESWSNRYGRCRCGGELMPVWFLEEELEIVGGVMVKTGRTRRACSHLTCSICLKNNCVDDSFDVPYR